MNFRVNSSAETPVTYSLSYVQMTFHCLSMQRGKDLARTGSCLSCSKHVIGSLFSIWAVSMYQRISLFLFLLEGNADLEFCSLTI